MTIIRGHQAIAAAAALGVTLCKYADPIEDDAELPDFDDAETFGREAW